MRRARFRLWCWWLDARLTVAEWLLDGVKSELEQRPMEINLY